MANLLIEIGNTALKAAWSEGTTIGKIVRYQGQSTMDFILSTIGKEKPVVMAVASINPISSSEEELLRSHCLHLMILDSNHHDILQRSELPEYLSYDRAASLVAARYLFKGKPCSIFDLGTTLTVDFLDSAGVYHGGNVSPGCRTRFKALNRYSKTLPLVDTPETIRKTGNSEVSSIESGVISGIMFEIEGYIDRYPTNVVVFTGGDAIYFAKKMKNSIFVICNLVLKGLALITDEYVKKSLS